MTTQQQLDDMLRAGKISEEDYNRLHAALREQLQRERAENSHPKRGPLQKKYDNKVLGGVAAGFAEYFKHDPILIRLLFVVPLVLSPLLTGIAYLVLYFVMPDDPDAPPGVRKEIPWRLGITSLGLWGLLYLAITFGVPWAGYYYNKVDYGPSPLLQSYQWFHLWAIHWTPMLFWGIVIALVVYYLTDHPKVERIIARVLVNGMVAILAILAIGLLIPLLAIPV